MNQALILSSNKSHQKCQVPKMEVLNLMFGYFGIILGVGFPFTSVSGT